MNKTKKEQEENKIKIQTCIYFIQQKFIEILIIALIIFVPFIIGENLGDNKSEYCTGEDILIKTNSSYVHFDWSGISYIEEIYEVEIDTGENICKISDTWLEGFLWIIAIITSMILTLVIIYTILKILSIIIISNLNLAKKRAIKKINKSKK